MAPGIDDESAMINRCADRSCDARARHAIAAADGTSSSSAVAATTRAGDVNPMRHVKGSDVTSVARNAASSRLPRSSPANA